ncbi:hypothetical protein RIF29_38689 [Crotalaria pallida]|uniref:DUF8039 domain-containing protein n=1 Tax=Crotalaria pallida TaxID=3830 RepID=A0AAN9E0P5_CROPI
MSSVIWGIMQQDLDSNALLSKALNRPEHSSCLLGVGLGVSRKTFLRPQKRARREDIVMLEKKLNYVLEKLHAMENNKDQNNDQVKDQEKDQNKDQDEDQNKDQDEDQNKEQVENQPNISCPDPSVKDSCTFATHNMPEVHNLQGTMLHNSPLPENHVKVTIDVPLIGNAPLPIPIDDDISKINNATGTFVAWPTQQVFVYAKVPQKPIQNEGSEHTRGSVTSPIKRKQKDESEVPKRPIGGGKRFQPAKELITSSKKEKGKLEHQKSLV